MTVDTQVMADVDIVSFRMRIWTGTKKLHRSDLTGINLDQLPSEKVASLGVKRLVDDKHLKPMNNIRSRAESVCSTAGVRFLGGYAIPREQIAIVLNELNTLQDQFETEVDNFLNGYDANVEEWADQNPSFANQIRLAKVPQKVLASRFYASVSCFKINPSENDHLGTFDNQSDDLMMEVFEMIAAELKPYVSKVAEQPNGSFRSQVRKSIGALAIKIRQFSFLDMEGKMVQFAMKLEDCVSGEGLMENDEYAKLGDLIKSLHDTDDVASYISSLDGNAIDFELQMPDFQAPADQAENEFDFVDLSKVDDDVQVPNTGFSLDFEDNGATNQPVPANPSPRQLSPMDW